MNHHQNDDDMRIITSADVLASAYDDLAKKDAEIAALRKDYEQACKLVADMHMAAMGAVIGPVLGVVEDVAALKADAERYHWLKHRDSPWLHRDHPASMVSTRWSSGHAPDEIDAAIDAAMTKEPK